jgi:hypothetical protein
VNTSVQVGASAVVIMTSNRPNHQEEVVIHPMGVGRGSMSDANGGFIFDFTANGAPGTAETVFGYIWGASGVTPVATCTAQFVVS